MANAEAAVIVDLANRYKEQFTTTFETLRRRGVALGDEASQLQTRVQQAAQTAKDTAQPTLDAAKQSIQTAVTDLSEVPAQCPQGDTFKYVLETYAWTGVCLLGASIGAVIGGFVLSPVLTLAFSTWATVALAYGLLPVHALMWNRKDGATSEQDRRMLLLSLSVVIGVLNGHNLADCYMLQMAPPAFVMPLVVAVMAEMAGPRVAANRPALLGVCLGSATVVYLAMGLVTGQLGFGYLLQTVVSAAVAGLGLQLMFAQVKRGSADMIETQIIQIAANIALGAALTYTLAYNKEGYEAARAAQQ